MRAAILLLDGTKGLLEIEKHTPYALYQIIQFQGPSTWHPQNLAQISGLFKHILDHLHDGSKYSFYVF